MPDKKNSPYRSRPQTNTFAFTCYVADLLRLARPAPEPDDRQDLVTSELEFVLRAARRVARQHEGAGVDLLDLIQEGNVALLQAVEEWLRGQPDVAHFHTFVSRRVYRALRQCAADAEHESGRLCSLEEHWDEVCQVQAPGELDPLDRLIYRQHQEVMAAILGSLERKRKQVVALRFGFPDGRERTCQEIGEVMGFSAGRASQLMQWVRKRLRHPIYAWRLMEFCQDLDAWGRG
jgi:RNA polymerase sigma factor (sigma-70 family)